ncbi:hypothetical protein ElyMa_006456200 [Elysia marginata]|uniref:Uncharacterized protein n=1 Tax=Elysia marginata TaxID=1093978 RepID=A0AAV4HZ79_9GAST|nr:hypothetical protein ElyMa_006456200 [Elysia marginata]
MASVNCQGDKHKGYQWGDIQAACPGSPSPTQPTTQSTRVSSSTWSTVDETQPSSSDQTGTRSPDNTETPDSDGTDTPVTDSTETPVSDGTDTPVSDKTSNETLLPTPFLNDTASSGSGKTEDLNSTLLSDYTPFVVNTTQAKFTWESDSSNHTDGISSTLLSDYTSFVTNTTQTTFTWESTDVGFTNKTSLAASISFDTETSSLGTSPNEIQPTEESTRSLMMVKRCPAKNLTISRTYSLPESDLGFVWNSPETCARGNASYITVECIEVSDGKISWSPSKVNSLCDYSSLNVSSSKQTKELAVLSLISIDKDNVEKVGEDLKTVIADLEPENTTEADVVFIADTLQKVAHVEQELPQTTVQNFLDSVNQVSRLPERLLQDAQNFSDATNRILRTADKLGSLLQLQPNETNKRLVSGGFGLEVWDIDKRSTGDNTVIGIKVTSDDNEEEVAEEQLVTQFSNTSRTYNNTQTAIYLPREILAKYLDREDRPNVRLVMNVYKDTSLYAHSASRNTETGKVNRTLNSRVIAAQVRTST